MRYKSSYALFLSHLERCIPDNIILSSFRSEMVTDKNEFKMVLTGLSSDQNSIYEFVKSMNGLENVGGTGINKIKAISPNASQFELSANYTL